MVVPFSLILFLSFIITPYALEKRIKENWDRLAYPSKVYELYSLLGFRCLWFCDGKETENFHTLQEVFDEAVLHGIEINLDVEELAITDSLIKLAYSLYYGRVDPSTLYKRWNLPKKPDRVISGLSELIRQGRIRDLTVELSPQDEEYWFLVEKAKDFRDLSAFDWKPIKLRRTLSLGGRSPCIDEIRFRLFLLGDLERYEPSDTFDGELFEAVKGFQRRHGLPETGSIDARTLKELNILPAERLKMIYLNLEKRRWLHIPFVRYILVNVPSFEFFWVEGYELKLYSRVIVGRNYKDDFRPTPMTHSRIESITINPKWYVPVSIATKDILPKVRKNPNYLIRKGFKVYYRGEEVDPLKIDWSMYSERNFPFMLVQEAGPQNALGGIKFNFPNPFQVYLHDTPEGHLFRHPIRAFSSGCIRVERAKDLALYLLGNEWDHERLSSVIKSRKTQTIKLRETVPIYILYNTAFEREGKLHLREDLYEYDKILSQRLFVSGGRR